MMHSIVCFTQLFLSRAGASARICYLLINYAMNPLVLRHLRKQAAAAAPIQALADVVAVNDQAPIGQHGNGLQCRGTYK